MRTKSILCVSFDQLVSEGRCTALGNAGFRVTPATRFEDALALLMQRHFDLVVLGHRFSREEKYLLAVEAEEKRNTPVVLVCGSGSLDIEIPATVRVLALEGITGILEAVDRLLPERAVRSAA